MSGSLRLLMLEDNPVDAELNERVLRKAGITFEAQRVETKKAFVAALEDFKPDLILADYKLPGFDGLEALAIAREKAPQTPYIFVTGAMGEERAVESIKQGATDYLLKDRLARLPEAVQRAIVEKAQRAQLREVEDHYHQLFENLSSGVMIFQPDASGEGFVIKAANRAVERIEQLRLADLIGRNVEEIFPNVRAFGLLDVLKRVWGSGESEHFPPTLYADSRITSWRECYVYRFGSNEVVAVYEDVSERLEHETQIKWLNRILRTISACNEDLVHAKCEEDLLKEVCRDIVEIGGHLLASVAYPGENPEELPRTVSHYGDETVFRLHAELDDDPDHSLRCLTMSALSKRKTTTFNRLREAPEGHFEVLSEQGVHAILALPLLNVGHLYGALTVYSSSADAFDEDEVKLMEELAADLAYGIDSLRTLVERDRYISQFGHAMKNTVTAIARTLEMRDPYTAGHQQRVTALAVSIGRKMRLRDEMLEGLYFGASIHDIGKISVPAEILTKPGKLSALEFMLIQQHVISGFEIVKGIEFPWPVAEMIAQHHERLDGSGYPKGLKTEEIILEARIIAVADVFEVMSTHRPYRPALGIPAALEELEKGKGKHYDPLVVEACIAVMCENDMKLPQL